MRITRRSLLVGAGAGAMTLLLASCTGDDGDPSPASPSATPDAEPTTTPAGMPDPAGWMRSAWSTDAYSRGAMSYLPAGAAPGLRDALAVPVDDRLFFAGEATDADRPGTVDGAADSGSRAAADVIGVAAEGERIAVIGAGVAGARAAKRLAAAGFDVMVLEARDRIGGRLRSVVDDDWPAPVQLGAWLAPGGGALSSRLTALDIADAQLDTTSGWAQGGERATADTTAVTDAIAQAADAAEDPTLADALAAADADAADDEVAAVLAWWAATTGIDPARASSWYAPELWTGSVVAVTGDLAPLVSDDLGDIPVSLETPVLRIATDENGVSLQLGTGEAVAFDRVVVTVPLGVLQEQSITFDPPLPFAHRGAIAALGSGEAEAVWLRFDEAFWQTDAEVWQIIGGDATIRTWFNLLPSTGAPVLVGIVGGPAAADFAALDDDDAQAAAVASLAFVVSSGGA